VESRQRGVGWIGEAVNQRFYLEEGTGPAMDEEEGNGVNTGGPVMYKVERNQARVIELLGDGNERGKLLEVRIEMGLCGAPRIVRGPRIDHSLHYTLGRAVSKFRLAGKVVDEVRKRHLE